MRRMKIVVTGGSGQLGRQVVAELCAAGHAVLSVDRQPHPDGHSPARIGNLLDPAVLLDACAGADGLVHLAAHIAPNIASDTATFNDNTQMTYNALHAAAADKAPACDLLVCPPATLVTIAAQALCAERQGGERLLVPGRPQGRKQTAAADIVEVCFRKLVRCLLLAHCR